ncbi:MAG: T9SS type B sorting domain-containing protein, partial [Flavobacteriaceae bacterium]
RWYRLHPNEREELLSETPQLSVSEEGDYRVVAYNTFDQSGYTFECEISRDFTVTASEKVISIALDIGEEGNGQFSVTVEVEGSGDYEYALNDINGPYQDSNRFDLVDQGESVFYVRDKNGCGIGEKTLDGIISVEGFPKFFTPNNDGKNDYWQYKPPNDLSKDTTPKDIYIYDRYGGFMGQIDPESKGWDGEFKGIPLPSSDYWYVAILHDGQTVRGHFTLKR